MDATVILADRSGCVRRAIVEWAGPATLGQLLAAAGLGVDDPNMAVTVDGTVHGVEASLDHVGLHDGTAVSLSPRHFAHSFRTDVAGQLHVAVTAGPGAGTTIPLGRGATIIGTDAGCELVLPDAASTPAAEAVVGRHAVIHHEPDGSLWLESLAAGTTVDGRAVTATTPLLPGQEIRIGMSVVEVRVAEPADAVADAVGNVLEVRRPPRLRRPVTRVELAWPAEPDPPVRQPIPWLASLAPIAMGVVLYLVTHTILLLLFIGLSPIMAAINVVTSRRNGKIFHRHAMVAYRLAVAAAEAELVAALTQERQLRLDAAPDAATLAATATGPRRRLWERRRHEADFLHVRLGLATLPASVRRAFAASSSQVPLEPLSIEAAPAVISLTELGVVGVAGPPDFAGATACWLVAQAAVTSGPADLQLVILTGESAVHESRWAWARWLPHTLSSQPGGPAFFGTTSETLTARITELVELIGARRGDEVPFQPSRLRSVDWPHVLVVMDPAFDIRRLPGVDLILRHGPSVGVQSICVDVTESYLPVECQATITPGPDGTATLVASDRPVLAGILLDAVAADWFDAVGRALAPYRDPEGISATGTIPTSARLVDLLRLDRLDATGVLAAWARSHRSTTALLGVGVNGPFHLDLRLDGPHGLVAGTTGAGKSEFLQTLIAALAVANRHDALNFLLVDYKGGSAFRDCARLPHTVGVVTDLDGHLTARALESLSAELKRREELLARGGAKDIDDYVTMGEPAGALPRLLIIIDEFAGLVAELPDFVTGLVGIAQRGRSLGIHMVLATQRPSGVVSPEIRANTNLRVALRVTSAAESADVIDAPDAARIMPTTPGRAYARTGHSALTAFQSARVGGPATPVVTDKGPEIAVVDAGWTRAGKPPELARVDAFGQIDPADTDLARLTAVLTEAADASGIPRQPQPWLPPLPTVLLVTQLGRPEPAPDRLTPAPFAVVDLPAAQRQEVLAYHPGQARHLGVVGGPGSGRTTLLRTLAVGLATLNRPEDVWLYAIDCGGGELRRLSQLPHTGAVVTRTEIDRTSRLLTRLHDEMSRRLERLASEGYTDVTEQRAATAAAEQLPYIVVFVDRWEGFLTTFDPVDNQRLTDLIVDIAREGGGAGIRLVVTGDRSILSGRLAAAIDERLCLSLPDRNDYAFAGLDVRKIPDPMPPGRAVRTGDIAELQIAVPGADPSGAAQAAAMAELVQAWRDLPGAWSNSRRPYRVDILPTEIEESAALAYPNPTPSSAHSALVSTLR